MRLIASYAYVREGVRRDSPGLLSSAPVVNLDQWSGAFSEDALNNVNVLCGGLRPWLGDMTPESTKCGNRLRALQRGASNVYFAHVASSIYLPLWGEESSRRVVDLLEDPEIWQNLSNVLWLMVSIDFRNVAEGLCEVQPQM